MSLTARRAARENNLLIAGSSEVTVVLFANADLEDADDADSSGWRGRPANASGAEIFDKSPSKVL